MTRPVNTPPLMPPEDPSPTIEPGARAMSNISAFGLSPKEFRQLVRRMLAVVQRIGVQGHVDPLEVVQHAFVLALCKPISERPPIEERKRFVAWICTLTECSALTFRKSKERRLYAGTSADEELEAIRAETADAEVVADREALKRALAQLDPDARALIIAVEIEGKTIAEMAQLRGRRWTTVDSQYRAAMEKLRKALGALVAVGVLLVPAKARALWMRWSNRLAQSFTSSLAPAAYVVGTLVACGVMVPSGGVSFAAAAAPAVTLPLAAMASANAAPVEQAPASLPPPAPVPLVEVEPVKPSVIDKPATQCSAARMKTSKIAGYLQGSVLPFAFLVLPTVTTVGCGSSQVRESPPPTGKDDAPDYVSDPYKDMCEMETMRGNDCPTREEWESRWRR